MAVPVSGEDGSLVVGKVRELFTLERRIRGLDVDPDGCSFLVTLDNAEESTERSEAKVTMILNWFDELRRRVPTGG